MQTLKARSILFLNPDFPAFPGWAGDNFLVVKELTRYMRVGLVSQVHFHEQEEKSRALQQAGVKLYLWRNPVLDLAAPGEEKNYFNAPPPPTWRRRARRAADLARSILTRRPIDTFIQDFNFRNLAGPLWQALTEDSWDTVVVVQSSHANWLDYLPDFPASVLILHDVRTLVYQRQAELETRPLHRWLLSLEAGAYRGFEKRWLKRYDLATSVSPADAAWAQKNLQAPHVSSVPLTVDLDYFAPADPAAEIPYRMVFTGMMNHPPNTDAALYFANQVFPLIQRQLPQAEFWLVGRDPTPEVLALQELPGVHVTGQVPDIRPYLASASLVVVPLRFGAGMRNKILEAWSSQKAVLSTSIGAEGLEYTPGESLVIADDTASLAQQAIRLLQSPQERQNLQQAGRQIVLQKHSPQSLIAQYHHLIQTAYQNRPQTYRALVDLRWMIPGAAGGIETLARAFLDEAPRQDAANQYTVLLPPEAQNSLSLSANFQPLLWQPGRKTPAWLWEKVHNRLLRRLGVQDWHSPEVQRLLTLRKYRAEVALSVPGYIHPELYGLRNILILTDLQHEYFPQFFSPEHVEERRRLYGESLRVADFVCAISEFTRQTAIEKLALDPQKIIATPLGVDAAYLPGSPWRGRAAEVCRRYGLAQGAYLFLPGKPWPHKNHAAAFRALRLLREEYHLDISLVLTGSPRSEYAAQEELLQRESLQGRVHFLGRVPATDLPALYEGAAALLFPSLFEGFGMPVLEAMACDCPVVCSNTTSLPEVAGEAALLRNPEDPASLAEALAALLTDSALRAQMLQRGAQRYPLFTWQKFTAQILAALRRVALGE